MNNKRAEFKELLDKTVISNYNDSSYNQNQIRNLMKFVRETMPSKLYKYRKFDSNTIDFLKNFTIHLSNPHFFNDPYDCQVFIDKNEIFEKIKKTNYKAYLLKWQELNPNFESLLNREQKKSLQEAFRQNNDNLSITFKLFWPMFSNMIDESLVDSLKFIKQSTKISCFSEEVNSPLMWAHYTDSHKGFALEYDFTSYITPCVNCQTKCSLEHYESLFPIVYSNERFNANNFLSEYMLQKFFVNHLNNLFIPKDDELAIYKIFLHKSMDWEYEKEWRFVSLCQNHPGIKAKPIGIYLGCIMEQENKNKLIAFAKENNISIYQMQMNFFKKQYSFEYKEI